MSCVRVRMFVRVCELGTDREKKTHLSLLRPQVGSYANFLGLHQGNELWCVQVLFGQESMVQGNCYFPKLILDLK